MNDHPRIVAAIAAGVPDDAVFETRWVRPWTAEDFRTEGWSVRVPAGHHVIYSALAVKEIKE